MRAEFKIVVDVTWYRLRRFEMANLGAAALICVALALPAVEAAQRLLFGAGLNVLVYLNNDYLDRHEDARASSKDHAKTAFLVEHASAALRAQLALACVLVVMGLWLGGGLLWAFLVGGGVCWAYSAFLKRRPVVDVLAMIVWGIAMPMVAVPIGHADGWSLLIQVGLFSGAFETIQVLRDRVEDQEQGVRTTAVVLGPAATRWLLRGLLLASAFYAAAAFSLCLAPLPLLCAFMPIDMDNLSHYWNRVRALLGLTFLVECLVVLLRDVVN